MSPFDVQKTKKRETNTDRQTEMWRDRDRERERRRTSKRGRRRFLASMPIEDKSAHYQWFLMIIKKENIIWKRERRNSVSHS